MPPEYIIGIIAIITIFIIVIYVLSSKSTVVKHTQTKKQPDPKPEPKPKPADVRINMQINSDGTGSIKITIIPAAVGDPNVANLFLNFTKGNNSCASNINGVLVKLQSIEIASNLLSFTATIGSNVNTPFTAILDMTTITNGKVRIEKGTNFYTDKVLIDTDSTLNGKNAIGIKFYDNNKNKIEFMQYI